MAEQEERWVEVQKRTFTNWVNIQLKERSLSVSDLQWDLADGHTLINLVELLSKKSVGKYSKRPQFVTSGTSTTKGRQEMLHFQENIDLALNFLRDEEGIKIVNIGGEDVVKGNLRIILGLIWTLILRYHIQEGKGGAAKQAKSELLAWINGLIGPGTKYGLEIKHFTSDWEDGRALLALIDALDDGVGANWNEEADPAERNKRAVALAEKEAFVPPIIASDDVGFDELSMVAYLDYFRDNQEEVTKKKQKRQGFAGRAASGGTAAASPGGAAAASGAAANTGLSPGVKPVRATWR